jgi:GNAT superfamily N-acetyltransferase
MDIRRAGPNDVRAAARVYLASRKAAVPAVPEPVHSDGDVLRWFAEVLHRETEVWVADGGSIVGVMALSETMVEQLYVAPLATGSGVGSELLNVAKAQRPGGLGLWTFQSNAGARRFYERHGFVAVEWGDGTNNENNRPDVRYVWQPGSVGSNTVTP